MSKHPQIIRLGYRVGSGEPVDIPLAHTFVTGQTQLSGKTTTLRAIVESSGRRALAFVTKRGETFDGRRIAPYLPREGDRPIHWRLVETIMASALGQRSMKYERLWIVNAAKGARSLADVRTNVTRLMEKAKGNSSDMYMLLGEYLDLVLPEMKALAASDTLELGPGLNVMDLIGVGPQLQAMVIRAALERINEHETGVLTVFPEAWEFAPRDRVTPAKDAAIAMARKGSVLGNYLLCDSQDISGVDTAVRQAASVWILGVQREANELNRTLAVVRSAGVAVPKPHDVATLSIGQFFVCHGSEAVKTYVQPAWMSAQDARAIAMGEKLIDDVARIAAPDPISRRSAIVQLKPASKNIQKPEKFNLEDDMSKEDVDRIEKSIKELAGIVKTAVAAPQTLHMPAGSAAPVTGDEDAMYERFKARLLSEGAALIKLAVARPEIEVEYERKVVVLTPGRLDGKIGAMILRGFFDSAKPTEDIHKELKRHGIAYDNRTFGRALSDLTAAGALTLEDGEYKRDPETKITGVEK